MNDTTREIGGALGVAIMGSITAARVRVDRSPATPVRPLQQASPEAAEAVQESVGGASVVAAETAGAARRLDHRVGQPGVRRRARPDGDRRRRSWRSPARRWPASSCRRRAGRRRGGHRRAGRRRRPACSRRPTRSAAAWLGATLELLADAGMSSLTYNGIATRSGISTATLERYWGSRVDAVTDAIDEICRAQPIPDTGDLAADLGRICTTSARSSPPPRPRGDRRAGGRGGVGPGAGARPARARARPTAAASSPSDSPGNRTRLTVPVDCRRSTSSPGRSTSARCSPTHRPTTSSSTPSCVHSLSPIAIVALRTGRRDPGDELERRMQIGVVFPQTEIGAAVADVRRTRRGRGARVRPRARLRPRARRRPRGARAVDTARTTSHTTFHEPFVLFGYLAAFTRSSWSPGSSSCPSARPRSSPSRPPRSTC